MLVAILCGPTAVGKSALALRLAEANGFEILSADSRQIYRGLVIGTGAPSEAERARVPHHLVGFLDPSEPFSHREYPARVHAILSGRPEARFLLVGGTGLYLKELLYPSARDRGPTPEAIRLQVQERLDREGSPALHAELLRIDPGSLRGVHPNDAYRVAKRWENHLITGEGYAGFAAPPEPDPRFASVPILRVEEERAALYSRIDQRVAAMVRAGWIEEVRGLMGREGWRDFPGFSSLGYREIAEVASGAPLAPVLAAIQKKTRNYAKRQETFFRHQFPAAQGWPMDRLSQCLEACGWDWSAFAERHLQAPGSDVKPLKRGL